jgi:hypothetical protein
MAKQSIDRSQVRLVAAGFLSLILLVRITIFDDSWLQVFQRIHRHGPPDPTRQLLTATISLLILAMLSPVLIRGRCGDKLLAALVMVFPLFMFTVSAIQLL